MMTNEEALKDFNDNLQQSNINHDVYHVKGIKFDTVNTIRKALAEPWQDKDIKIVAERDLTIANNIIGYGIFKDRKLIGYISKEELTNV